MKHKFLTTTMTLLAAAYLFSGCGKKEEPQSAVPPPAAAAIAPETMVARVEGTVITGQMLSQQLNAMIQQYSAQVPPEQLNQLQPMLRQQAVESLINQDLLLKEAQKQGITPTPEEIDAQIEQIIAQFPSPAAFEAQLAMAGVTQESIREDIFRNLQIQNLIKKQFPDDQEATTEEIETFYSDNAGQFEQPEQVEASHILIRLNPGDTEEEKTAKLQTLQDLRKQIEEGADFAETARTGSEDTGTAERGGDLGFFGRGQMIPAFEEAAFALQPGEISEIVETQFGYHLIRVSDKREGGTVPLEEVSEQIGLYLVGQKQQEKIGGYLSKLREGAQIEYGTGFSPVPPPPAGPAQFPPARPPQ